MPRSRVAKSMAEKKEVVTWIEQNGELSTRAATYFHNERGWKISGAQVRYWWKQKESIKSAPVNNLRLKGAGAKPRLAEVEDMIFNRVLFLRSEKKKVTRDLIAEMGKHLSLTTLNFSGQANGWTDSCTGTILRYVGL
ncbi:hypothetical protein DVH05_017987 [Phytophthora capsici]|nr:hypothetical protein DVH05_017987 [Phytophthora capsici]